MRQEAIILCGRDLHYLKNLTDYLTAKRVLDTCYTFCTPEEFASVFTDRRVLMVIFECGAGVYEMPPAAALPVGETGKLPVVRLVEDVQGEMILSPQKTEDAETEQSECVLEKYRSARELAGEIELFYYRFYRAEVPKVTFYGMYNLFLLPEAEEQLLAKLRRRGGRKLIVNLREFAPITEGFSGSSIADLLLHELGGAYHPKVPELTELEHGIYGIEGFETLEDYRLFEEEEVSRMLAVFADISQIDEVWIDFGPAVTTTWQLFTRCRELWIPGLLADEPRAAYAHFTGFLESRRDLCRVPEIRILDWEEGGYERTGGPGGSCYSRRTEYAAGIPLS